MRQALLRVMSETAALTASNHFSGFDELAASSILQSRSLQLQSLILGFTATLVKERLLCLRAHHSQAWHLRSKSTRSRRTETDASATTPRVTRAGSGLGGGARRIRASRYRAAGGPGILSPRPARGAEHHEAAHGGGASVESDYAAVYACAAESRGERYRSGALSAERGAWVRSRALHTLYAAQNEPQEESCGSEGEEGEVGTRKKWERRE
ncbi:hypothetical protein C8J57DRAFT_1657128 [Mycena rebaudengoi]|nr:hypothetical protein C8J57DRAFT_1657128 [Mycena rebaudengoi]